MSDSTTDFGVAATVEQVGLVVGDEGNWARPLRSATHWKPVPNSEGHTTTAQRNYLPSSNTNCLKSGHVDLVEVFLQADH